MNLGRVGKRVGRLVEATIGPTVADVAERMRAVVLDSGVDGGLSRLIGNACAGHVAATQKLVGVAAELGTPGLTVPEPHHQHIVLADAQRPGEETPVLFGLADALAHGRPVAALLVAGGSVARTHALEAVHRGWPLVVLAGSGGTADSIVAARTRLSAVRDVELGTVIPRADIRVASSRKRETLDLTWRLSWALNTDLVLQDVWKLFAKYDSAAKRLQRTFKRFQSAILLLGILVTVLALLYRSLGTEPLHWGVIVLPMIVSALIALAAHRAAGQRWVVLRGAAESVKSEIFCYRTEASAYTPENLSKHDRTRPEMLADRVGKIERHLAHTEASSREVPPYDGPLPPPMYGAAGADDGLHSMTLSEYVDSRVADQIRFYRGRTSELERWRTLLQLLAVAASGAGALIAAAGAEIWVAVTTAISAAPLAYLAHLQADTSIAAYNHSAARLEGIERRWQAHLQSGDTEGAVTVVRDAEAVLTSERGGWVAHMSEALRDEQALPQEPRVEP